MRCFKLLLFKVDKLLYERQTETLCTTSDIEEIIKTCNRIDGDYNLTVWKDGKFLDVYMDLDESEIREIFC